MDSNRNHASQLAQTQTRPLGTTCVRYQFIYSPDEVESIANYVIGASLHPTTQLRQQQGSGLLSHVPDYYKPTVQLTRHSSHKSKPVIEPICP